MGMTKKRMLVIAAAVLLAAALTYLFYTVSAEKTRLAAEFMNSRVIPIVAEFGICTSINGLAACQDKVRGCGLSIKAEENDWTTIPQETALKCASDLAPSQDARLECSSFVVKARDLSFAIRHENDLLFGLFGASEKTRLQTNTTLEALGNCMGTLQVKGAG